METKQLEAAIAQPAKSLVGETVHKSLTLIRDPKLIGKSLEQGDDSVYGIASCEVMDTSGDIVMIDGIDTSEYHNPPKSYMKILAQHLKVLPNGESPIIGRVEEFFRAEMDGKKVLAFRMTWAKDGQGNLKPLAASYKADVDGGYMDSFSVGMVVLEYSPIDDAGYKLSKTVLTEISCVTIPANPLANVMRSLEKQVAVNVQLHGEVKTLEGKLDVTCKAIKEMEIGIVAAIQKFESRFDYIESTLVAAKSEASPATGSRKNGEVLPDDIEILKNAVSKLNKVITR